MNRIGIEPCQLSEQEGTECICGLMPEGLLNLELEDGVLEAAHCRLCGQISDHIIYRLTRFDRPWRIEVCPICGSICNEYL
ncbi:MAG TPA: hypothetical protein VH186_04105 [Chloroflexia bacterium]|nr:hypothetical protein [Chloroflexia bacterium]